MSAAATENEKLVCSAAEQVSARFSFATIIKGVMKYGPRWMFVCISTKRRGNTDFHMKNEARRRARRLAPACAWKVELMHFVNSKMEAAASSWLNLYEHITQQTGQQISRTGAAESERLNTPLTLAGRPTLDRGHFCSQKAAL